MDDDKPLAKFRHPPLIEVVHGVQFEPLPMTIIHPGLFYTKVQEKYPQTQSQPPLAPVREVFDREMPVLWPFGLFPQTDFPRAWFVSQDDTLLIQLQNDRLLLNWRRGPNEAEYPHFENVSNEFQRIYRELEAFVADQGLGQIRPNQCEMTYINHLNVATDGVASAEPGYFFNIWHLQESEWHEPLEDLAFNMRFLMRNKAGEPIGRLIATLGTLLTQNREKKILQLDLTARGVPIGEGLPAVKAFHEIAHRQIVTCFAGITSTAAQEKWERRT